MKTGLKGSWKAIATMLLIVLLGGVWGAATAFADPSDSPSPSDSASPSASSSASASSDPSTVPPPPPASASASAGATGSDVVVDSPTLGEYLTASISAQGLMVLCLAALLVLAVRR